jgi:D-psicose/D-tagatose/L-ribulose 3-epimerase
MRFGMNAWFWVQPFTTDDLWVVKRVQELGFNHIEISIESVDQPLDYKALGAAIKDNGLSVSVCAFFDQSCDFACDDTTREKAAETYMRHCVDAIGSMGGDTIGGPFYSSLHRFWHPADRQAELAKVAKHLKVMGAYAADHGVTFGVEVINRYETSFINTSAQGLELVQMVDHPAVGVMLDTFHMGIEEKDLGKAIELAGDKLVHLHSNEHDRGVPGSGHTDWTGVAAALKKIGYDRALVVESFNDKLAHFSGVAKLWRPIIAEDTDLGNGASFLRQLFA